MQSVNDTSDQHVQTSSESRCDVCLASLICTPFHPCTVCDHSRGNDHVYRFFIFIESNKVPMKSFERRSRVLQASESEAARIQSQFANPHCKHSSLPETQTEVAREVHREL